MKLWPWTLHFQFHSRENAREDAAYQSIRDVGRDLDHTYCPLKQAPTYSIRKQRMLKSPCWFCFSPLCWQSTAASALFMAVKISWCSLTKTDIQGEQLTEKTVGLKWSKQKLGVGFEITMHVRVWPHYSTWCLSICTIGVQSATGQCLSRQFSRKSESYTAVMILYPHTVIACFYRQRARSSC